MDWCRLWHDMTTDPKWRVIARKSGCTVPEVVSVYTHMLVVASSSEERGTLADWDDEYASAALDMDPERVAAIRQAMQGHVLEDDRLTGWEKRQPGSDDSAKRKRKERERRRDTSRTDTECHVTSRDGRETECDLSPEQRREEQRRTEKNNGGAVAPEDWDSDHQLFHRGKAILGAKSGGQIAKLRDAFGSIYSARRVVEAAAQKQNPTEYVEAARRNELERQRRKREPNKNQIAAG